MGKRSDFKRRPQDRYFTPVEAVRPLLPFLEPETRFAEPCAGDGRLVDHLEIEGYRCIWASDIEPMARHTGRGQEIQVFDATESQMEGGLVITNPPWSRPVLHSLIQRFMENGTKAWLLFDADWKHTKQARPYLKWLAKIVSVGRVKWIEGSKHAGKDNCCWYLFDPAHQGPTEFYGR